MGFADFQKCRYKSFLLSSAITRLPNELVFQIFERLPHVDRICLAMTCGRFMQLVGALKPNFPSNFTGLGKLMWREGIYWPSYHEKLRALGDYFRLVYSTYLAYCTNCKRLQSIRIENWSFYLELEYDHGLRRLLGEWCIPINGYTPPPGYNAPSMCPICIF